MDTEQLLTSPEGKPSLGVLRGVRPRPTYTVPVPTPWQEKAFFPKSNSRRIAPGATVHWKVYAWRDVDGSYEGVQSRLIRAVAYEGAALACYFTVVQTRNSTDDLMDIGEYAVTCDDESENRGHHAEAVREALAMLEGRDWLWSGEAATELSELYVPEAFKNRKLWQPAMNSLLNRLASSEEEGAQVCVLHAVPLELAWRQRSLSRESEKASARERRWAARRENALQALYERELGFTPLGGHWMGRLVHHTPHSVSKPAPA